LTIPPNIMKFLEIIPYSKDGTGAVAG
jgi:hypothetical protein